MRYLVKNIKYNFSIQKIVLIRKSFIKKICFKKKYQFLQLKYTPTYALNNRLMRGGKFLKIYKQLKYFFNIYLLIKQLKYIPLSSSFLYFYNKFYSFRDLDRVLLWKYNQLNCMFSYKVKKLKKKKNISHKLLFITNMKRLILCINFLKYLILLNCKRRNKNLSTKLFYPLFNYITNDKNNLVLKVKYKLYKKKLNEMQS